MLISFSGFLRAAEALALKFYDVTFHDSHAVLVLRGSKTDQLRKGNEVPIAKSGKQLCPIGSLQEHVNFLQNHGHVNSNTPLFPRFHSPNSKTGFSSRTISYSSINDDFKKAVANSHLKGQKIGLHSLRAGGATAAAQAGFSGEEIKAHGRWRSESSQIRYVETDLKTQLSIPSSIFN